MPLPLILPSVPPPSELAEVVLVSAAAEAPQGIPQSAPIETQTSGTVTPVLLGDPSLLYLTDAELLLPQAQVSPPLESPRTPPSNGSEPLEPEPSDAEPSEASPAAAPPGAAAPPAAAPDAPPETPSETPPEAANSILLRADQQVFEPIRQIVTASGDVLVQFGTGQLAADRLWANLANRHLRAEGNVFFNRNNQIIEGETATYNLLQGSGTITESRGELELSTLANDFSTLPPSRPIAGVPLDYRLQNQPSISQATSAGGIALATGDPQALLGGEQRSIDRLRYEADQISFDADGSYADNIRLTNDPFSPPDLEFRASHATLTPLNETQEELVFDHPRLVFNQGLSIPLFRNRFILTQGQLPPDAFNPLPAGFGIDGRDRDGFFVEAPLPIGRSGPLSITVAPQFLVSRWLGSSNYNIADPANFGLAASVSGPLGPRTTVLGNLSLSGFDLSNLSDRLRASLRARRSVGTHRLNFEYSYRDRLFNGSLGFQDVQNSLGLLLESPNIALGGSGINLNYQVSGQYVTANTDRSNLLSPGVGTGLASLFRFQGSADLSRGFLLWQGQPLPATQTEGLRYSPRPVVPNLALGLGMRSVVTYYTSSDLQQAIQGRISLAGQLGHLQRNTFDYTQFNIGFSHTIISGDTSPFLFDRTVDRTVLSGGITQQIYGPFLAGFQTAINLDTGRTIDTNLIFEYRRRAYGFLFTYSPKQETGFLGFRISGFDWVGRTAPFDADPSAPSDVVVQ
ncbi:DUF3769 domain-containing protein [Nodosilinea nodulosa]|uniref:DUF3769 domain-containing protein n=1 Tax=Nodosilinea nodulosa TaxID=416001 RepID=UPI0002D4B653|nr:DUF3769 domain-containing protein [Nodosilinea nodulosa]